MQKLSNAELERPALEIARQLPKIPLHLVLDNVRSALNTGAVFRTCDAFRIHTLHLCGITAYPPHREIQKTALGATESVNWQYWPDTLTCVRHLKSEGIKTYAAEQVRDSILLQDFMPPESAVAVILGHEMEGVSQNVIDLCDGCIEIPQGGIKHSLNVSVSAGIICWEIWKKRRQ